ncbi:Putative fluoride ion transporter CrcB [Streptomyces antimycoticus]
MGSSRSNVVDEPIDPDTGPTPPARHHPWRGQGPVVGVVAVGGALGATARYGASLLWPTPSSAFPWTILLVNAVGCAVIGVFLVLITEMGRPTGWYGPSSAPVCSAASPPSRRMPWTSPG